MHLIDGQWSPEQAHTWYTHIGVIRGANYLPRSAVNMTEMWQADTFDPETINEELNWAKNAGYNSVRIFLQFLVWQDDAEGLKQRFHDFLNLCDTHNIHVMPILFCDCSFAGKEPYLGRQDDPVPGVHNSGWVPSPGLERVTDRTVWPDLEAYVTDMVGSFAQDRRISIWDLYNEPGNSGLGEKSLPLTEATFAWARAAQPSQPLTSGVFWAFDSPMAQRIFEISDIISFHTYNTLDVVRNEIALCETFRRPIICTEWLKRQDRNTFDIILPLFAAHRIGWYNWGLVAGRTQTYMHWGSEAGTPIPDIWQDDIFHDNGTPYDAKEIDQIKSFTFDL